MLPQPKQCEGKAKTSSSTATPAEQGTSASSVPDRVFTHLSQPPEKPRRLSLLSPCQIPEVLQSHTPGPLAGVRLQPPPQVRASPRTQPVPLCRTPQKPYPLDHLLQCNLGPDTQAMNTSLATLDRELASSLRGLTSAGTQLRLTDNPSQWSIHQIALHLLLTYRSTVSAFESRIAKGTPTLSRPTLDNRLARFVVVTLGKMPGRRQSPPEVAPAWPDSPLTGEQLAISASDALSQLNLVLDQAIKAFGSVPCQAHFALGPLTAEQWGRFHLSHGRHHIRQILAIRRMHRI